MRKGTYLELTLHDPTGTPASDSQSLARTKLAGSHSGLTIQVVQASADAADPSTHSVVLYVEGDQPAPEDFKQLATNTVRGLWAAPTGPAPAEGFAGVNAPAAPQMQLMGVGDWEDYDETENLPVAGNQALFAAGGPGKGCIAPVTGGAPVASEPLPVDAPRPAPVDAVFDGCPPGGTGTDQDQNTLKNRTDVGDWQLTTVGAILSLDVPAGLSKQRANWSSDDQTAIGHYEGLPLQVVGYLAGARVEGPESCNCHSVADIDFHLWLVDTSGTGRDSSVVCEVSPRVRANHPGWTIDQICTLVNNQTQVRISGWLMMDPLHPDQVGNTRGTTWEIHPIIAIDVAQNGDWIALDNI